MTLSVEDTETDAINRLLAGAGGTWSSWVPGDPSTCLAEYDKRTTGFSFFYQEAQWRVQQSGLLVMTNYNVKIAYYRRLHGTSTYTLLSTNYYSGDTDGMGNLDIEGDVPILEGYDTYAAQATCP